MCFLLAPIHYEDGLFMFRKKLVDESLSLFDNHYLVEIMHELNRRGIPKDYEFTFQKKHLNNLVYRYSELIFKWQAESNIMFGKARTSLILFDYFDIYIELVYLSALKEGTDHRYLRAKIKKIKSLIDKLNEFYINHDERLLSVNNFKEDAA